MRARKRLGGRDNSSGEQRGKEVSKGRGPPRKEMSLPGQRAGGSGREVKLPCKLLGPPESQQPSWPPEGLAAHQMLPGAVVPLPLNFPKSYMEPL